MQSWTETRLWKQLTSSASPERPSIAAKLLELLSGIQLYKEPLVAVRELLQNAFDAVKEQIALERLEGDARDEQRTDAITALQSVELRFEERDDRFWLLCTDSGVGMTRPIIEKYLLVSGSSRRHDILELERRCEAAGFYLGSNKRMARDFSGCLAPKAWNGFPLRTPAFLNTFRTLGKSGS